ncbi:MAG: family 20 glycosylhydrolase, partial [Muribaculaceae bacterium]|nr:family 20 glycosylhydrolase [Muribaculaceae bacterium]
HWHLTDDQGWRIESKKYPRLTEIGSYRPNSIIGRTGPDYDNTPVSGFYTQDEAREIVKYAADRHIMVVPEVDLPGHMMAAMASYPELGCTGGPYEVWRAWGVNDGVLCPGKDVTMKFIEDILSEVAEIFPAPYFHIGGDECPKVLWAQCPDCQARIKELGLEWKDGVSPESQLQGYVTRFACDVLGRHGKRAIGWDEILECDIPRDAVIMSWRGVEGAYEGTARGHEVILTPTSHCYFDFYQTKDTANEPYAIGGLTTVEKVYGLEPCLPTMTDEQRKLVLGAQSNLWTEYIPTFSHAQYMELPRLAALSEVQWRAPEGKDFEEFKTRIPALLALYDKLGYNYAKHIADVEVKYNVDTLNRALVVDCSALPG